MSLSAPGADGAATSRPGGGCLDPDGDAVRLLRLLRLLQLASPSLPVGAYSYSEGLEQAVAAGHVADVWALHAWLKDALLYGGVQLEAAVLVRAYQAWRAGDRAAWQGWDEWLTATRESEELRTQSLDMGRALLKLFLELAPGPAEARVLLGFPCNFASVFALAAASWEIPVADAVIGYLHGWTANLVGAGVKLVPLGQTAGQRLLWDLQEVIARATETVLTIEDRDLAVGNWGQTLASMGHETQYSRLFRS